MMKKEPLAEKAMAVFKTLPRFWHCEYDESGAIGKRYHRQDELVVFPVNSLHSGCVKAPEIDDRKVSSME